MWGPHKFEGDRLWNIDSLGQTVLQVAHIPFLPVYIESKPMAHGGWPSSNVTPVGDPSQELGAGQLQRLALPMLAWT